MELYLLPEPACFLQLVSIMVCLSVDGLLHISLVQALGFVKLNVLDVQDNLRSLNQGRCLKKKIYISVEQIQVKSAFAFLHGCPFQDVQRGGTNSF